MNVLNATELFTLKWLIFVLYEFLNLKKRKNFTPHREGVPPKAEGMVDAEMWPCGSAAASRTSCRRPGEGTLSC